MSHDLPLDLLGRLRAIVLALGLLLTEGKACGQEDARREPYESALPHVPLSHCAGYLLCLVMS